MVGLFSLSSQPVLGENDGIDEYVKEQMEEKKIPGLALAVIRAGKIVKARGYGLANIEHSVPVRPNTIFQSGSVGKQFTSMAIMMLVEDGKLGLDSPVSGYLTGLPDTWKDITVRNLLTHTSGIREYEEQMDYRRDLTEEEFVEIAAEQPLDFAPGEHWSYSNTGYVLLGVLIGKLTGAHWGDFVQERIFERLGMSTARVISDVDIIPNRAAGYRLVDGELKNHDWVSPFFGSTGDGALYFSLLDVTKWDAALYGDKLLTREGMNAMWTPVRLNSGKEVNYGFGWTLNEFGGHRSVEHSGHWQGFSAFIARYVDDSLTVVVLTNQANLSPVMIAHHVAGLYDPELRPAERREVTLTEEILDSYVGRYEFPSHVVLTVSRENDRLLTSWGEDEKRELLAESEETFFYKGRETLVQFVRNDEGETSHVVVNWGVAEEARKIE
jgi:CubicO group peptidase (beta-lactamase class C family)